ncbi:MAG: hypothetical protein JSW52_01030 [Candidatus Coatesbacteria bacterium]|nr:MAG: hypothetical protein JSW52_01030 [Candidatus Coatesbacteria bacterium]
MAKKVNKGGSKTKKVTVDGRPVEIRAELDERPPLGPVVAEVHIKAPLYPPKERKATKEFIRALLAAYKVRAAGEPDVLVVEDGDRAVVTRKKADGETELRFRKESSSKAIMYCDERELSNLEALGILDRAYVKKDEFH